MGTYAVTTMDTLLGNFTEVFSWITTTLGTLITTVTDNPLLLIGVILPILGVVIGYFKRLTK